MSQRILLVFLALFFASLACRSSTVKSPEDYVNEYGGNVDVYRHILSLTDCTALQSEFDVAAENNARETAGTKLHKATLGYMTAADAQMKILDCYSSSDGSKSNTPVAEMEIRKATFTLPPTLFILPTLTQPARQFPTQTSEPTATILFLITAPAPGGGASVCPCTANILNCSDFSSSASAQSCMDHCIAQGAGDIHKLDRDGDGLACESN